MRPFGCPVTILNTIDHLGEEEKKDTKDTGNEDSEVPSTEEPRVDQKETDSVNDTNRITAVSSTVNAANNEVNGVGRKSSIELPHDPNMPDFEDISIFEDSNEDVFGAEADLNNIKPTLSFMKPFGCPVTILNTIDHLGKFDGKADEEFFVGYSTNSKAFRVFNSRTRIVEENLYVKFSENTPNIVGSRPNWLFDIDALTKSMNYKPIVARNQSNGSAGTKACDNV
nr:ribonuclease H-like domain-containing protein [Tanacetum cinerariifolium]